MRQQIEDIIAEALTSVEDGLANPLKAYVEMKRMGDLFTEGMKQIKDQAMEEATKYGSKTFRDFDASMELKSAAGRWSFDHIEPIVKAKEALKKLEDAAKSAYKTGITAVTNDGEHVPPAHYTGGEPTLAISFKPVKQ